MLTGLVLSRGFIWILTKSDLMKMAQNFVTFTSISLIITEL